jgi:deoxyribodipyrimidine photo-lyase
MQNALVWFRQDIRIHDNPALHHACKNSDSVTAIYIYDENLKASAQNWWLHHSLTALKTSLEKLGINLVFAKGEAEAVLQAFIKKHNITDIYWNRLYDPKSITRDTKIKESIGIAAHSYNGGLLTEPWLVKNKTGGYFKVFTAFYKHCLKENKIATPLPSPQKVKATISTSIDELADWNLLPTKPNWAIDFAKHHSPGEANAREKLADFLDSKIQNYANLRDFPADNSTSNLSPHLHFGEISPATIFHAAQLERHKNSAKSGGIEKFISELYWREFSYYLLFHFPEFPKKNFRPEFDSFPWAQNNAALKAWQKGQTGYPIVDAGMRELWHTGTMHNRVRMVAASFLIKHLLIDWREGAAWFMYTLLDADIANNSASWQWVAGSGVDASPYFRIFNPVTQGEKFDKNGDYIRTHLPELANLPNEYIHTPWKAPANVLKAANIELGKTYANPIIEHSFARERALEAYKEIKNNK